MKTYDERLQDVSQRIAKHRKVRTSITTACITMAVVILALVLFVPYNTDLPDVTMYASSPYYSLIQKINEATYVPPQYENNFEAVLNAAKGLEIALPSKNGAVMDDAVSSMEWYDAEYVEVTDNQVNGVIEADIIKRSTEYIYYLRGMELSVYSIAGEDSSLVGQYTADQTAGKSEVNEFSYTGLVEMYLSADCKSVTLVVDGYNKTVGSCTVLICLDVTDPEKITETNRVYISGSYLSSRLVDGDILVMNKYRISSDCDFDDESTFVPQVGTPENITSVAAEDILSPDELSSTQYTVICRIDGNTLEIQDTAAFLSYSDEIYVSAENIFATRSYSESVDGGGSRTMTEISAMSYAGDTLEYLGSVSVAGSVKNQYSMDEYEGILRVVTSTNGTVVRYEGETVSASWERNASLYCISLDDFSIVASVENFAPANEQAESVRFDGDYAYVCTAEVITLTDPVYFFDLSDLNNITYTDTGTIDGYSSSLIQLGGGYLMGIGYGGTGGMKIEIYEETADGVVSVCAYEANADISEDYKSYFVDRENDLIGLGIVNWGTLEYEYLLLHFDGYDLNEIARIPVEGSLSAMRAVLIDGYLYVFSNGFTVEKVW